MLKNLDETLTIADMYRFMAFLLLSHTIGLRFEKSIQTLRQSVYAAPSPHRVRFIAENIMEYSPTGRGSDGPIHRISKSDQTG